MIDPTKAMVRWSSRPPGFWLSVEEGCTCPVADNCKGWGLLRLSRHWWVDTKCPLHRKELDKEDVIAWKQGQ